MINCKFENGNQASLRHVVVDTLIIKEQQILLVKRSNKIIEGGKWGLVGGFVDRDETIEQAVAREIKEETGYSVRDINLLWINNNPNRPHDSERQNIEFVFYATAGETTSEHDWEVTEMKWFPLDELPPKETIAFDHALSIEKYLEMKKGKTIKIL